jgi:tripartite-type tricarboxylate transporter receptor subunit TctC
VRLVVAFPAGGPTDFVARLLADQLKSILGQSVLVENKSGANAAIGADFVAKSDPDGYTLFFTTMSANGAQSAPARRPALSIRYAISAPSPASSSPGKFWW